MATSVHDCTFFSWMMYLRLLNERYKKIIITVLIFWLIFSYDLLSQKLLWWRLSVMKVLCRRHLNNSFWQPDTRSKHSKYSGFDQFILVFWCGWLLTKFRDVFWKAHLLNVLSVSCFWQLTSWLLKLQATVLGIVLTSFGN